MPGGCDTEPQIDQHTGMKRILGNWTERTALPSLSWYVRQGGRVLNLECLICQRAKPRSVVPDNTEILDT